MQDWKEKNKHKGIKAPRKIHGKKASVIGKEGKSHQQELTSIEKPKQKTQWEQQLPSCTKSDRASNFFPFLPHGSLRSRQYRKPKTTSYTPRSRLAPLAVDFPRMNASIHAYQSAFILRVRLRRFIVLVPFHQCIYVITRIRKEDTPFVLPMPKITPDQIWSLFLSSSWFFLYVCIDLTPASSPNFPQSGKSHKPQTDIIAACTPKNPSCFDLYAFDWMCK